MTVAEAYRFLYSGSLVILAVLIGAMLVRSVIGPRITDRILSVNMIGTMVIVSILILSQLLNEPYLVDVALIYTMISFLSVLIFASVYISGKKKRDKSGKRADEEYEAYRAGKRAEEEYEAYRAGKKAGEASGADFSGAKAEEVKS